jgi:hypothetical protein
VKSSPSGQAVAADWASIPAPSIVPERSQPTLPLTKVTIVGRHHPILRMICDQTKILDYQYAKAGVETKHQLQWRKLSAASARYMGMRRHTTYSAGALRSYFLLFAVFFGLAGQVGLSLAPPPRCRDRAFCMFLSLITILPGLVETHSSGRTIRGFIRRAATHDSTPVFLHQLAEKVDVIDLGFPLASQCIQFSSL